MFTKNDCISSNITQILRLYNFSENVSLKHLPTTRRLKLDCLHQTVYKLNSTFKMVKISSILTKVCETLTRIYTLCGGITFFRLSTLIHNNDFSLIVQSSLSGYSPLAYALDSLVWFSRFSCVFIALILWFSDRLIRGMCVRYCKR